MIKFGYFSFAFILFTILILLHTNTPLALADRIGRCSEDTNCNSVTFGLSADVITAYPGPNIERLEPNYGLMNDRRYMQVTGALPIYDAPDGNLIRTMDPGFNFVTVIRVLDNGWAEVNPGEWARTDNLEDTNWLLSSFTGALFPGEQPTYPIGWTLVNLYPSRSPGGEPYEAGYDLIYRYTQVNIFATVEVDGFRWYQIGPEQWIHQYNVAKVIPLERPQEIDTERWISINLYEEIVIAYEGNRPVFATLTATGLPRWPTREGLYHIYYRRTRDDMSWGTVGDDYYYLEEVPWTMFFDEGRALHGAYWHDGFGFRRSHGCVNLSITDAHWLYNWVAEDFDTYYSADREDGPAVWVFSSDEYQ